MKIEFNWWNADNEAADIPQEHKDQINKEALDAIAHQFSNSHTSGSLVSEIDGINYNGLWAII